MGCPECGGNAESVPIGTDYWEMSCPACGAEWLLGNEDGNLVIYGDEEEE